MQRELEELQAEIAYLRAAVERPQPPLGASRSSAVPGVSGFQETDGADWEELPPSLQRLLLNLDPPRRAILQSLPRIAPQTVREIAS